MIKNEYANRRYWLSEAFEDQTFALFASGEAKHKSLDQHYKYFPERNFFYLTGLTRENFILLLARNKQAHLDFLFIEEPSEYATKWLGSRMTKEEASDISGIDIERIFYINEFEAFLNGRIMTDSRQLILKHVPEVLYLDMYRAKAMAKPICFDTFGKVVEKYPELHLKNINAVIAKLRRKKAQPEIDEIKKALEYTKAGIYGIFDYAKPGINERELEATFDYKIQLAGAPGRSFDTIVASGKNATILHYVDNNQEIKDGDLVLLDLGALSNQYAGDISRSFPVNGKFTKRQAELYQMVLDVNKETIKRVKPGIYVKELNDFAREALAEGMIKLGKIKDKSEITKYYYHGVSHYLGLDVHDVGTYSKKIVPGVVLTVEPGIYIEEEGIGIRIEDNILVTEEGYENLSKDIIKEIKDIEAYLSKKA